AKEIFLNGGPVPQLAASERCGQWLAFFHRTAPPRGRVAGLAAEFPRYRYWTDLITRLGEPLASKAERLFRRLEARAPASGAIVAFYPALDCLHGGQRQAVSQAPRAREWADGMLDEGLQALDSARGRMVKV